MQCQIKKTEIQFLNIMEDKPIVYGINVNSCGYQRIGAYENYPPKKNHLTNFIDSKIMSVLPEYHIVFIKQGSGILIENNTFHKIVEGDLFIIKPGQKHSYFPEATKGWDEYYMKISGRIIDELYENLFMPDRNPILHTCFISKFVELFETAVELNNSPNIQSKSILADLVMQLLGMLFYERDNVNIKNTKKIQLIENAKILMSQNLSQCVNMEELSKVLNVSYSYFRRSFKNSTGYSPANYIKLQKIRKAKKFLIESNLSIKEIGYNLGYNSPNSFVTTFKTVAKVSPTQYRRFSRLKKEIVLR